MTMTTTTYEALTLLDRCDRCGAQARKRYDLNGLDLLLCGHHDRELSGALRSKGARLVEDLDVIDAAGIAASVALPESGEQA